MGPAFLDTVATVIDRHALIPGEGRVLVGVSGGVDSMVCLSVLHRLGYDVHALHVNYGLREGADDDQALVERWCAERTPSIPLQVEYLNPESRAAEEGESLQEAARVLRYDALVAHAADIGADAVAVGQHRDDQAETLLLNLVRGTGPEGLAGMPPSRLLSEDPHIPLVRPLLEVSRAEIEAFAEREEIPWREDPTNRDPDYDRAVIRTRVMPLLKGEFPGAADNIARAARHMQEYVEGTLTPTLQRLWSRGHVECEAGTMLLLEPLREVRPVWRRRLLLAALERTFSEAPRTEAVAEELEGLIEAQVGRKVEFGQGTVWRERKGLRFLPFEATTEPVFPPVPVPWGEDVPLPRGVLRVDPLDRRPEDLDTGTANVVYADADRLVDPLSVGTWQEGDQFQPLGLDGTKLVSDLLTDEKVPPHRRAGVYVLSTDDHPAWVVGHRLDDRVRIRASTRSFARLRWQPDEKASDDCISA